MFQQDEEKCLRDVSTRDNKIGIQKDKYRRKETLNLHPTVRQKPGQRMAKRKIKTSSLVHESLQCASGKARRARCFPGIAVAWVA